MRSTTQSQSKRLCHESDTCDKDSCLYARGKGMIQIHHIDIDENRYCARLVRGKPSRNKKTNELLYEWDKGFCAKSLEQFETRLTEILSV